MSQHHNTGGDDFHERAIPTVPQPRPTSENTGASAKGRIPRPADRDRRNT